MPDMTPKKTAMPTQEPTVRARNFDEVALGYTLELAKKEAARCLDCKNPACVKGCPVGINIPLFIKKLRNDDINGAYETISEASSLPRICGRVCPQENQCESKCVRGIKGEPVGIGRLERFVADNAEVKLTKNAPSNGKKVAVIGSGPAGLTCAGELIKKGFSVTVFEALHAEGGVLLYGIPEFRLPKTIVRDEVDNLKSAGVNFVTNAVIGKTLTIDELFDDGFNAVFIGSGAGLPNFMNIPGESCKGVLSANEFLTRNNLMKAYKDNSDTPIIKGGKVAVVGGGNVAMDAARTALRLGAEKVYIVYRRSIEELPARKEEVEHAMEEGVEFMFLCAPTEINATITDDPRDILNGYVKSMTCIKMELGEPDEKGRRSPIPLPGSEFILPVDAVIMAIGTSPNPLIKNTTVGLETNRRGCIVTDENGATSLKGVFAGGDAVTGAATVISSMGAGKRAAAAIAEYLNA